MAERPFQVSEILSLNPTTSKVLFGNLFVAIYRKGKLKERKGRETGTQKGIECEKERERESKRVNV